MPDDALPQLDPQLEAEARALIGQNRTLDAIMRLREELGWSLKEAKEWVDLGVVHPFRSRPERKPCPSCGQMLRTIAAKQCFACGADWH